MIIRFDIVGCVKYQDAEIHSTNVIWQDQPKTESDERRRLKSNLTQTIRVGIQKVGNAFNGRVYH